MANLLDEMEGPVNTEGRDINVIERQLPATTGIGSIIFEFIITVIGFVPALVVTIARVEMDPVLFIVLWVAGVIPGMIYWISVVQAKNYFRQLEQRIQAKASDIDNFLEQRVVILNNVASLVTKAIELDRDVMKNVAALRGNGAISEANRNAVSLQIDRAFTSLVPHVEAYPELKAHAAIAEAMRQNSYLQKEITAARTLYNDTVTMWNTDIFAWPVKQIVAARAGYTTRIPFTASKAVKEQARERFFE